MRPLLLCYHAVSSTWQARLAMPDARLREQLTLLRDRGYEGLTFAESERRRSAGTLPRRSVVVTFDDGYRSVLRARPLLDELGYPATVFVATRFLDSGERLAWQGLEDWYETSAAELDSLTWTDLQALADSGWEVGSHSVNHYLLSTLPDDELAEELTRSRETIAARLGRCETLAYPYGRADERVAAATRDAGYLAACTVSTVHAVDEPFRRPRIDLSAADTGLRLRLQLSAPALRLRRTAAARLARRARVRRSWLPAGGG